MNEIATLNKFFNSVSVYNIPFPTNGASEKALYNNSTRH